MIQTRPQQLLLSLPPNMVRALDALPQGTNDWFAISDPGEVRLGSGGGTAHLLVEAWRATGLGVPFSDWLRASQKLMIHGGGQSRRLPAYAAIGKPFLPIPVLRQSYGQRLDQTLLDFQRPIYQGVLSQAPPSYVAMVTSGDVLLRFGALPEALPDVDILALGMAVAPETAQGFGVFFSTRENPREVAFFQQKPSAQAIHDLASAHTFLVDTGIWLLSERAVGVLLEKCGWNADRQHFAEGLPGAYELYAQFGLSLGRTPQQMDPLVSALSCAVISLPQPEFYHLGTSRQLIEAVTVLQNRTIQTRSGAGGHGWSMHPDQFVQNAKFDPPARRSVHHTLWVENSTIPSSWQIAHDHVLTGVPENDWSVALEPGVCMEFAPFGEADWAIRVYGMDDRFSGACGDESTLWLGQPLQHWLDARGLDWSASGIDPLTDLQHAPLFPVLPRAEIDPGFLMWLWGRSPVPSAAWADLWSRLPRLSAHQLAEQTNLARQQQQRDLYREWALQQMRRQDGRSVFYRLDLGWAAGVVDRTPAPDSDAADALALAQDWMFHAAIGRRHGVTDWEDAENAGFAALRRGITNPAALRVTPRRCVLEDQIIWGRSPVRLDLAGGWTDTPPFCLTHGGQVVNLAVDLNGQPPIQVFAKLCDRPQIVLRSIDLGVEERLESFEALRAYAEPGSEFALAKAALSLAGFVPEFCAADTGATLTEYLERFGGGIEISLLAAVPKGSGLGTSSILAATLLGTLSELCGLGWSREALVHRSLVLEQMLTTGGGWQDPVGGVYQGVKLVETEPGLQQQTAVRWLPEYLFREGSPSKRCMLLYYTGLTRMAKHILQDIVRGMFLNDPRVLDALARIGDNAQQAGAAIGAGDYPALCRSVAQSWRLNQALDAGTNPPAVKAILDTVASDGLSAAKLLGAGGGGYLLLCARDPQSAQAIRDRLTRNPPNDRARFVDFSVSETGLQVTRS